MKNLLLLFLLFPLASAAQLSVDQQNQVDSLNLQIKSTDHDSTLVRNWTNLALIILPTDSDAYVKLNEKIDSLCSLNLKKNLNKKEKIAFGQFKATALDNIGLIHQSKGEFNKAINYFLKSTNSSQEVGDKIGMTTTLIRAGNNYYFLGNYPNAITYYTKSLRINEEIGDTKGMALSLSNISAMYQTQGIYDKAIEFGTKSLKIAEEIDDKEGAARCLNNIGNIYYFQSDYDKAISYYTKSLNIKEAIGNQIGTSTTLSNIGVIYEKLGDYDNAMDFNRRSLHLSEEIDYKIGIAIALNNIGSIYQIQKNYVDAVAYTKRSLAISEGIGDQEGIATSLNNLGTIYQEQGSNTEAREYTKRGLAIAQDIGFSFIVGEAAKTLWIINKESGRPAESLEMYELYIATRDSMESEENKEAIIQQQYKYSYEKQAATDSIKSAEATKVQEALLIAEKAKNQQNQQQQYFLYAGLVLALLFGGFIFNRFKLANKQKAIIEEQKLKVVKAYDGLEEAHKEITDSINYAERIQRSFLATKELLDKNLNDYFVFFQPKNVVSGDFYWAGKLANGNFAIVNADSTGHGVPGAIMSILNISSIESAIKDNLIHPHDIFNHSRKTIIERLKKDGSTEGGKDGMDASIICLDFEQNKFSYTAAQNPIWVVRNDELIEIKPEKMPIGKHHNDHIPFVGGEFETQKGDQIYTLTDGFWDQFGGPKGKKFMVKRMREHMLSISHLPMQQQQQNLKTTFDLWKGNNEQIDDVCIIGVKL